MTQAGRLLRRVFESVDLMMDNKRVVKYLEKLKADCEEAGIYDDTKTIRELQNGLRLHQLTKKLDSRNS